MRQKNSSNFQGNFQIKQPIIIKQGNTLDIQYQSYNNHQGKGETIVTIALTSPSIEVNNNNNLVIKRGSNLVKKHIIILSGKYKNSILLNKTLAKIRGIEHFFKRDFTQTKSNLHFSYTNTNNDSKESGSIEETRTSYRKYNTSKNLPKESNHHKSQKIKARSKNKNILPSKIFTCTQSNKKFLHTSTLKSHLREHKKKKSDKMSSRIKSKSKIEHKIYKEKTNKHKKYRYKDSYKNGRKNHSFL